MQSISSRIWTRVAVSISYDDNHYITGTYNFFFIININTKEKFWEKDLKFHIV